MAECLSSAPIYLEIKEFPPAPIPFPNPTKIKNKGVIYPNAAKGSAPNPTTHILSIILLAKIKNILAIIGNDNLLIAFLGSPVIISILEFLSTKSPCQLLRIILVYVSEYLNIFKNIVKSRRIKL